jgi:hypothetical protein
MTPAEASPTGGLHPDALVDSGDKLAMFLSGGSGSVDDLALTLELLQLLAKLGPEKRAKFRAGFPDEVLAWELWSGMDDHPTARELGIVIDLAEGSL